MFESLRHRRVTVMGLGRFGGGIGAVRYLVENGARVTVTDRATEADLAESLAAIADLPLEQIRLGGHVEEDFQNAELIVASPAVPRDHPMLCSAGAPVTTEIGLFWSRCRGRVIGVTGTVGKSTTAAMIHAALCGDGQTAWLGGNIGGSLLGDLERITPDDFVVLELSSFQLEYLESLRPRAELAVVTNFRPNHLDRHHTVEAYRLAKQSLLRWQTTSDTAVLNLDDPDVSGWITHGRIMGFGTDDLLATPVGPQKVGVYIADSAMRFVSSTGQATLPVRCPTGPLALNATAAAAAAMAVGVEPATIVEAIGVFRGLPHRLEDIGHFGGRRWIDDSKATTPEAAVAALEAMPGPIRLVAGGADKGIDLSVFIEAIRRMNVPVYLSGQTAETIASQLSDHSATVARFESFDASVRAAYADSRPEEIILLSPGCASWGQFADFRARGARFRALGSDSEGTAS